MLRTLIQNRLYRLTAMLGLCGIIAAIIMAVAGASRPHTTTKLLPVPQQKHTITLSEATPRVPEATSWYVTFIITLPDRSVEPYSMVVHESARPGKIMPIWQRLDTLQVSEHTWPDELQQVPTRSGRLYHDSTQFVIILGILTATLSLWLLYKLWQDQREQFNKLVCPDQERLPTDQ